MTLTILTASHPSPAAIALSVSGDSLQVDRRKCLSSASTAALSRTLLKTALIRATDVNSNIDEAEREKAL